MYTRPSRAARARPSSCRSATRTWPRSSPGCAPPRIAGRHRSAGAVRHLRAVRQRRPGGARGRAARLAAPAPDAGRRRGAGWSAACSTAGAAGAHGAKPATSPTSAAAGAATTATWWCSTPTASCTATPWCRLARLMEQNPRAGIVQTLPRASATHRACTAAAVRQPRHRPAVRAGHGLLAARRSALLGAQRDPARRALHAPLRPGPAAGPRRAGRRDPVARLRRGRADAPRRLRGLARAATWAAAGSSPRPPCSRS